MTPEEINALPERVRKYIMWLETEADPAGTTRENFRLREENAMLRKECERLASAARGSQPIETAPKDGTPVLVWEGGRWIEAKFDRDAYDASTEEFDGAWLARWAEIDNYGVVLPSEAVTHWIPMPDPVR